MTPVGETAEEIDALLGAPTRTLTPAEFLAEFYAQEIRIGTTLDAGLRHEPTCIDAIRGALGRRLMEAASEAALAGQPCDFTPACALDVLFRERQMTDGLKVPKPYVLFLDTDGDRLVVGLTLFGIATGWTQEVAHALTRALRGDVVVRHIGRLDAAVTGRQISEIGLEPPGPLPGSALLRFLSPLSLRRGDGQALEGATLLSSLANRASGMARWHGIRLAAEWDWLKQSAANLSITFSDTALTAWTRQSGRQGNRKIGLEGWIGDVHLAGDLSAHLPFLLIGSETHVGARTALGLGRYALYAIGDPINPDEMSQPEVLS